MVLAWRLITFDALYREFDRAPLTLALMAILAKMGERVLLPIKDPFVTVARQISKDFSVKKVRKYQILLDLRFFVLT